MAGPVAHVELVYESDAAYQRYYKQFRAEKIKRNKKKGKVSKYNNPAFIYNKHIKHWERVIENVLVPQVLQCKRRLIKYGFASNNNEYFKETDMVVGSHEAPISIAEVKILAFRKGQYKFSKAAARQLKKSHQICEGFWPQLCFFQVDVNMLDLYLGRKLDKEAMSIQQVRGLLCNEKLSGLYDEKLLLDGKELAEEALRLKLVSTEDVTDLIKSYKDFYRYNSALMNKPRMSRAFSNRPLAGLKALLNDD